MSAHAWLSLIACAGQIALFLLAVTRGARSPLAMPLALLASTFFSSSFTSLGWDVTGRIEWRYLMVVPIPVSTAIALHFVLSFTGRRRSLAWLMFTTYAVFGALSAVALLGFAQPRVGEFVLSSRWSLLVAVLIAPAMALSVVFLSIHLRRASREEALRTTLILAALAWVLLLGSTEFMADFGLDVPRLGALATLGANFILAWGTLRLRLFGRDLHASSFAYASVAAAFAVLGYLAVFRFVSSSAGARTAIVVGITLALIATTRRVWIAVAGNRARIDRLATLGRFSSQMAHDIKNPLAALKGATQFLQEERRRGNELGGHSAFVDLIAEQIDRIQRVVDHYQRLGRVEPFPEPLNLNELTRNVLALQEFATSGAVKVQSQLADGLPTCRLDRDLVAGALENLVRNAFEAMPRGGTLTVRTGRDGEDTEDLRVFLEVQDTGDGMDARTRERAFDDFFTTKRHGTGHGLAFVRRVMDAHGGDLALTSKEGWGTVIRLFFPVHSSEAPMP
ncbi:MAG TPA: ATP-binding protein [Myxococcales bacterium]|nr:ATP-binding protein [Myxococcales bacterium]